MDELKEILLALRASVDMLHAKMDGIDHRLSTLEGQGKETKTELRSIKRYMLGMGEELNDTMDRVREIEKKH